MADEGWTRSTDVEQDMTLDWLNLVWFWVFLAYSATDFCHYSLALKWHIIRRPRKGGIELGLTNLSTFADNDVGVYLHVCRMNIYSNCKSTLYREQWNNCLMCTCVTVIYTIYNFISQSFEAYIDLIKSFESPHFYKIFYFQCWEIYHTGFTS